MSLGDAIMGLMYGNPLQQAASMGSQGPREARRRPAGRARWWRRPDGGWRGSRGPQAQPQPQAYQSPPDLSQMYVKLVQQSRAADSFDRGLALMAGGFKGPPGGAQTIMNSVGPPLDAGATMNNIMQLQQFHQQQLGALDAAGKLGITPNEALGMPTRHDPHGHADRDPAGAAAELQRLAGQVIQQHANDLGPDGQPIGPDGASQAIRPASPDEQHAAAWRRRSGDAAEEVAIC